MEMNSKYVCYTQDVYKFRNKEGETRTKMDMNLMHSNYVFNYRKSNSYFVVLICLVKVKSMSLIPNICHLWNSKFPSVQADVFFQHQNVSNLLIAFQRKYNLTLHFPCPGPQLFKSRYLLNHIGIVLMPCIMLVGACQNVYCRQI